MLTSISLKRKHSTHYFKYPAHNIPLLRNPKDCNFCLAVTLLLHVNWQTICIIIVLAINIFNAFKNYWVNFCFGFFICLNLFYQFFSLGIPKKFYPRAGAKNAIFWKHYATACNSLREIYASMFCYTIIREAWHWR